MNVLAILLAAWLVVQSAWLCFGVYAGQVDFAAIPFFAAPNTVLAVLVLWMVSAP